MGKPEPIISSPGGNLNLRYALLATIVLGSLLGILSLDPIAQNTDYHSFADRRELTGIPNYFNVLTNLAFLLIGIMGLRFCLHSESGPARSAWIVLFLGVLLVSGGSAYYHWNPTNQTLIWDRLPMTIGFMGLFVALMGEYIDSRLATFLLFPAIVFGLTTVLYWFWFDDLRPYIWVQLIPLLTIPTVMILFRNGYSHNWLLLVALGWYVLSKMAELFDLAIFSFTREFISGHSIKHLLAAAGCFSILAMLDKRKSVD